VRSARLESREPALCSPCAKWSNRSIVALAQKGRVTRRWSALAKASRGRRRAKSHEGKESGRHEHPLLIARLPLRYGCPSERGRFAGRSAEFSRPVVRAVPADEAGGRKAGARRLPGEANRR